ncbi:AAA family ATPase [Clostridiaceae bacterium UIB06]|uniref:AAA family ATPase n=1 Tax=Clostridium thailandense TaxID=2794346 RepID=A0A949WS73_9CLOT|nr:BTAD domain-containing putative transcriptional regulator [Clostridium thailandense]MBV7274776.1 AAA family ATPase [Clostridium thailandense]MCH5137237.1 AAA family ATPase [Clostridiaceae bacterium UIB06]
MIIINANLLGIPEVLKEENKIYFPYRKSEALFYYILMKKQVSRDSVVDLLWGNIDEDVAKKNLRNAVYSIKKIFNEEIIVSPKRPLLMLNPNIQFNCDVYKFLDEKKQDKLLENNVDEETVKLYKGDFLEGFYVKDAEVFEEWMIQERERIKERYIYKLTKCIENFMKEKNVKGAKNYCKKLFYVDDFNEQAYRSLMTIYMEEGKYGKAVYTYNVLKEKLKKDLGVSPDEKTEELYKEITKLKNNIEKNKGFGSLEFFYGRVKELDILMNNFKSFMEVDSSKTILIKGDAGIGKTRIVCEFFNNIKNENLSIISTNCYQAEEEYILKPWNLIFEKIFKVLINEGIKLPQPIYRVIASIFPNFDIENSCEYIEPLEKWDMLKYQAIESAAIDIINRICKKKRMILFFDDIQWIDQMSLDLMKNIILNLRNKRIMIIFACRSGYVKKIDDFNTFMRLRDIITEIEVNPLNSEETIDFAKKLLPSSSFSKEDEESMYLNTEGNLFFLVEYLNNFKDKKTPSMISSKMQDILKTRLYNLSDNARRLLSIISIFFDMVKVEEIQELVGENYLEIMYSIDELQKKALIKEVYSNNEIGIIFNHIKMREYVYSELSNLEKSFLHKKAAEIIEKRLKNNVQDFPLYSKLIYHHKGCNNRLKELEYKIKNLNVYLTNKHEIFPILYNNYCCEEYLLTEDKVKDKFEEINKIIKDLKNKDADREKLNVIGMEFSYIVGRDYIRKGEYERGFSIIYGLIKNSIDIQNYQLALQCYKQVVYYSMNISNFPLMKEYIDKAIEISTEHHYDNEIPVMLRLKGYEKIMSGELDEGEKILKKAIDLFNNLGNKERYILNIAAAYDFIGESKMVKKEYDEALKYYELAINMCIERDIRLGLPIFYTNAGQALYEIGQYNEAYNYISKALELYGELNFVWGRDKADNLHEILLRTES